MNTIANLQSRIDKLRAAIDSAVYKIKNGRTDCAREGLEDAITDDIAAKEAEKQPLPSVAGRMEMTHEDFQRACQLGIAELQEHPLGPVFNRESGLLHLLCEAVRCSRECCKLATASVNKIGLSQENGYFPVGKYSTSIKHPVGCPKCGLDPSPGGQYHCQCQKDETDLRRKWKDEYIALTMKCGIEPPDAYLTACEARQKELIELHQIMEQKLAACGAAAFMDTPEAHANFKRGLNEKPPDWSPVLEAILHRTGECIELRAKLAAAKKALD